VVDRDLRGGTSDDFRGRVRANPRQLVTEGLYACVSLITISNGNDTLDLQNVRF
jgi:hypothetical protein